ncbi:unnamed protein product [Cladocopium goreaui]|uniref:Uncharacterized protein n=1 Tax=Cladocopium goreaui TaxID=2562237 RepID=A0A9P1DL05_9DINO|nr:unnamed protein product [Cladocopium goreaui]
MATCFTAITELIQQLCTAVQNEVLSIAVEAPTLLESLGSKHKGSLKLQDAQSDSPAIKAACQSIPTDQSPMGHPADPAEPADSDIIVTEGPEVLMWVEECGDSTVTLRRDAS